MLTAAQYRVYSLVSRRLCPPLESACVDALRDGIRARHIIIRDGEWTLSAAGKAAFEYAREVS